jgi:hypothetical protein
VENRHGAVLEVSTNNIHLLDSEEKLKRYFNVVYGDVKCKECEYLMFSDCYGECSKGYKGIVNPNDSCGKGKKAKR